MGAIPALRDAGFSEDEIGTWANDKRQTLSGAGFSDQEIGSYFGDPQMVRPPSPGLIKRFTQGTAVGRVIGAFGKGWEDTAGQEPYGLSPETQQHLEKLPLFNAMWGPEVRTIAAGVDAANRAVQSGITGIGAAVGQAAQEFGASQGTGGRAARDVNQMLSLMPMFNGTKPMFRIERTPTGEVMSRPVGGLPREQDFTDASRILGDGTTEAQKAQVSSKLDKLYEEHGVHPAEVVHDAAHDPSIVQRLMSEGDDLPERYTPKEETAPTEPTPQTPEPSADPQEPDAHAILKEPDAQAPAEGFDFEKNAADYDAGVKELKEKIEQAFAVKPRFEMQQGDKRILVTRNIGDPEAPYRVTHFDQHGPWGHIELKSLGEVSEELYRDKLGGYQERVAAELSDSGGGKPTIAPAEVHNEIKGLIDRKAAPEEIASHPFIKQAYADADTRPHTDKLPGYGTPEFEAKREFNFKGEKIVGYDAYVDRLVKQAESYSTQGPVKQERTATIVLGPPASGKSTLSERIAAETHSAIVDSDDAKLGIPEYDGGRGTPAVHEESANIGARVVERMMDEGKNIIMPLVGANPASIRKRMGILNSADYKINLVNLDVAEDEAYRRMIGRFLKTGRIISAEYFESVDGNPKKTYYGLRGEHGVQQAVEIDGNGPPSKTFRVLDGAESELGVRLGGGGGSPPHPSDGAGSGALLESQNRPEVPREAVDPNNPFKTAAGGWRTLYRGLWGPDAVHKLSGGIESYAETPHVAGHYALEPNDAVLQREYLAAGNAMDSRVASAEIHSQRPFVMGRTASIGWIKDKLGLTDQQTMELFDRTRNVNSQWRLEEKGGKLPEPYYSDTIAQKHPEAVNEAWHLSDTKHFQDLLRERGYDAIALRGAFLGKGDIPGVADKSAMEFRVLDPSIVKRTGQAPPPAYVAAQLAAPIQSEIKNGVVTLNPADLKVDAKRFQFKEGGDASGVTDRLKDVKTWDPIKAGMVVAWEDKDGNRFIVDGHQRLALAQRIAAEDPAQNPRLNGWMLREGEGVTDVEARVIAASKNIAEGTGTAVDAAKVLRDRPDLINELPPRSELVRQARSLSQLEDEPFLMVVNGVVPPNYAAVVGRLMPKDGAIGIDAGKFQSALLEVLAKTKPENATQAEAIVRQGIDAGTHVETQSSLFGDTDVTTSLYFERAKVLDQAIKALKRDKTVFGTLVKEAETIEAAGSTLARDVNEKRAQADAQAIQLIQAIANRKGPVSDALNAAAQRAKSSGKYSDGVDSFVGYIRGQAESGDLTRLADGERRGLEHVGAEDPQGNVSREPPLDGAHADAEIADIFEGAPHSLGAAAAPPGSAVGRTINTSPSLFQRTAAALNDKASGLLDIGKDIEMLVAPMARGTQQSIALAKDFANSLRRNRWEWTRVDGQLERTFSAEQRKRMWDAADEESVAIQLKESREHQGLVTLTPEERAAVVQLQARAQSAWLEARDLGMVKGEGLPSYTPRMLINATDAKSGDGAIALNSIGLNLKTRTGQMKHRQHLTAEETEDAMRAKFGENAGIARDIRALPLATAKLEDAIAGRTLVDNIRDIGKRTGDDTVTEGAAPDGTPHTWFTIDHPALKTWRPKFKLDEVTGKVEPAKDADGNIIFEQVPIYIRGDFEGPLRAVLSQKSGLVYNAAMELKGKTMSLIMNSPLIHNAVEWGRALPAMPGKVATFKVYFEGNRAKHDPVMMQEAIDAGLVPIGHRGFNQDITSIMEAPDLAPGRSWTAKVLGAVPGLFDENAGNAVKRAIDRAGDFWHNTLLWDRVGDLQMGLYSNFLDDMIAKGIDRQTAARVSAHWANRYAGALPQEAMSDAARKVANLMLFSRSFTMGNLGAMKDMLTGLPRDVMAQVSRDVGSLDPKAAGYIKSLAVRKAVAVVMLDIGLLYVGNSVLQSTLNVLMNDRSVEDELRGYSRRLLGKLSQIHEHPLQLLQPFGFLQAASSTGDNEPGRENRIFIGQAKDGTAIYARNPSGKIGEEFEGYLTGPLDMLRRKLGTVARPAWQILSNDQGFGRHIYDPNADTPEDYVKNAGRIVWHLVKSQFPEGQISAAKDLATGQGDTKVNALQALGPIAGITFSKGAPGGPAVGELYRAQEQHRFAVNAALPDIRKQIKSGDIVGAVTQMTELGIPKGLQQFYLRTSINPQTRLSGRTIKDFYLYATPEQRQRFEEALHQQAAPSAH